MAARAVRAFSSAPEGSDAAATFGAAGSDPRYERYGPSEPLIASNIATCIIAIVRDCTKGSCFALAASASAISVQSQRTSALAGSPPRRTQTRSERFIIAHLTRFMFREAQRTAKGCHACARRRRRVFDADPILAILAPRGRRMRAGASGQVTDLLRAWGGGDAGAADQLIPLIYDELRA